MKRIILFALTLLIVLLLVDYLRVGKRIDQLKKSMPQLYSSVDASVCSYLQFDTLLTIIELSDRIHSDIMFRPDLKIFRDLDIQVNDQEKTNYSYPLSVDLVLKRNRMKGTPVALTLSMDQLNYWNYRLSKDDVLLISYFLTDALTNWVKIFTVKEIESEEIDIDLGRSGGIISGEIQEILNDKIVLKKRDWLIEAEVPSVLNYVKGDPDSCILHGMFKNKNSAKLHLTLNPAIAYNIGDTTFYKE